MSDYEWWLDRSLATFYTWSQKTIFFLVRLLKRCASGRSPPSGEGRGWFGYRLAAFIVSRRQKRWDEISMNKPRTQRNSNLMDSIVTKLPQLYYSENFFSWLNQTEKSLQSFYSNSGYISYTCTWDNNISHIFNNIWCTNSTVKWSFKSLIEISRKKSLDSNPFQLMSTFLGIAFLTGFCSSWLIA